MTVAQLPTLPPSVGTTVAMLATLAFVLASGARVNTNARAGKTANDVLVKAKRLAAELQATMDLQQTAVERVESLGGSGKTPTSWVLTTEAMAESIAEFQAALDRDVRAAEMLLTALHATRPHTQTLERLKPGWRKATAALTASTEKMLGEVRAVDFSGVVASVRDQITGMLQMGMAEQGMAEWAASLPREEEDLVDLSEAKPVMWDLTHGWISS